MQPRTGDKVAIGGSMKAEDLARQIQTAKKFFDTSTACLDESDSQFAPRPEMFTTAQHVAHVAQGIDILVEGAFSPQGFDTDVEAQRAEVLKVTSLVEARAWLDRAVKNAVQVVNSENSEELMEPLPKDGFLGGAPRMIVVEWMVEHAAHHRGALAVYARLRDKVPAVAYE